MNVSKLMMEIKFYLYGEIFCHEDAYTYTCNEGNILNSELTLKNNDQR